MSRAPDKPAPGQPCNGCGFCCAAEVCPIGTAMGVVEAPCALLRWDDAGSQFRCGAVLDCPSDLQPLLKLTMGIGMGCDSEVNDER